MNDGPPGPKPGLRRCGLIVCFRGWMPRSAISQVANGPDNSACAFFVRVDDGENVLDLLVNRKGRGVEQNGVFGWQ